MAAFARIFDADDTRRPKEQLGGRNTAGRVDGGSIRRRVCSLEGLLTNGVTVRHVYYYSCRYSVYDTYLGDDAGGEDSLKASECRGWAVSWTVDA